MTKQALAGIRVLDLSRIMAGPTAGQMLGDFGADVIKVERPGGGDDSRRLGGTPLRDAQGHHANLGPMFLCANRNKRSITVDIAKAEGQQLVRKLAKWADVVIENYKVGDLARYGLDYASLSAENPRLVYCSITGFGQTGPYAQRSGFDPIFQAMSGLMSVSGHPDHKPGGGMMRVGVPITDFICGLYAYGAIVTALYHRDQVSGRGQYIDLALLDAAISSTSIAAVDYLCNGALPQRFGNEAATSVPSQVLACADGAVLVSAPNNESFVRFCEALGEPDLAHHADFNDAALRIKNRAALTPLLEKIFAQKNARN